MVDVNNVDVNILDYKKVDFNRFLIAVMWRMKIVCKWK